MTISKPCEQAFLPQFEPMYDTFIQKMYCSMTNQTFSVAPLSIKGSFKEIFQATETPIQTPFSPNGYNGATSPVSAGFFELPVTPSPLVDPSQRVHIVALAVIQASTSSQRAMVYHEINIIKELQDISGVIKIIQYDQLKDNIVTQTSWYNHSLADLLKNNLSIQEKKHIIFKLSKIILNIHQRNIAHCDLKPNNIMMDSLNPILIDFGSAIHVNSQTGNPEPEEEITPTTPEYTPPRETSNLFPLKRDVYSLGAIIFDLLSTKKNNLSKSVQDYKSKIGPTDTKKIEMGQLDTEPKVARATPYLTETTNEDMQNAINDEFPEADNVELRDLLYKMLDLDATRRPSMSDVLSHPFFASCVGTTLEQ